MLNRLYYYTTPWAKASKVQILKNRILGKIANIYYPIWCKNNPQYAQKILDKSRSNKIIVSLTSYPARINRVALCLESILRQTMPADRVILWLSEEQFPNHELPKDLKNLELQCSEFEIRYCRDLRSYKKIYYTAQNFTDFIIITADDDTLYPENWIKRLYETSLEYQNSIICYRAHEIVLDDNNCPIEYINWNNLSPGIKGPSMNLVAIGVGGILYPTGFFKDVIFDYELINKLCPYTDDLWLKSIAMVKKFSVVKVDENSREWFTINKSQKTGLMKTNIGNNVNDTSFRKLIDYYHLQFHR